MDLFVDQQTFLDLGFVSLQASWDDSIVDHLLLSENDLGKSFPMFGVGLVFICLSVSCLYIHLIQRKCLIETHG